MLRSLALAGAAAVLVGSTLASPATATAAGASPPPNKITVDVLTVNGSGCPARTAAVAPAPDNTGFTVTYSNYLAQVGVGASPTDFRKNCQLSLLVHVPAGFTFAIAEADYRGFGHLEPGATGTEKASYYFQGSAATVGVPHAISTPLDDNWQVTDTTDVASLVFAPCGVARNLNVNTELRVAAGTSDASSTTSFLTMDSTDSAVSTVYHFTWMTCP